MDRLFWVCAVGVLLGLNYVAWDLHRDNGKWIRDVSKESTESDFYLLDRIIKLEEQDGEKLIGRLENCEDRIAELLNKDSLQQ